MPLVPTAMQGFLMSGFIPTMTDGSFASTVANAVNNYCAMGIINAPSVVGSLRRGTRSRNNDVVYITSLIIIII